MGHRYGERAKYLRTTIYSDNSTVGKNTLPFFCAAIDNTFLKDEKNIINTDDVLDVSDCFHFIDNMQFLAAELGKTQNSNGNFKTSNFVPISENIKYIKITVPVRPYLETAYTGLGFFDKNKQYIRGYRYRDNSIASNAGYSAIKTLSVPNNARYIVTSIFGDQSTIGSNTLDFSCIFYGKNGLLIDNVELKDFDVITIPDLPEHDMTFINNNLWTFITSGIANNLKIYNNSFNLIAEKTVNMYFETNKPFKFKSVDYREENGCLLIGTGDGLGGVTEDKYLYIFYEPLTWLNINEPITLNNCGAYTVIDFSALSYTDYSIYGFWRNNRSIIVTGGPDVDIYEIQLGLGTVQLNDGVYSYIDNDKFNGTYKILNKWIKNNLLDVEDRDNPYTVHGGDFYKGKLYFANSNQKACSIYRINLKQNGFYNIDSLNCDYFKNTTDLSLYYQFFDGMAIKDDYIYSQPLYVAGAYNTSQNSCLLKIPI